MQHVQRNMEELIRKNSPTPAATTIQNLEVYNRLKPSHRNVLARQVVCEAEEEDHDWWKRSITNKTAEVLKLAERRKEFGVACKSKRTYECFCDNLSSAVYCDILYTNDIMEDRKKIAKDEIGDELPCKNELWKEILLTTNNIWYLNIPYDRINSKWPELNANYTNSKKDVGQDIQSKYQINATNIEVYCILTPQVHKMMRKLRYVDIHFRIADDLLKMKFLSMVPFDFCNQDYLLSKCICDEHSSASFCMRYFMKQAVLVYVNENRYVHSITKEVRATCKRWNDDYNELDDRIDSLEDEKNSPTPAATTIQNLEVYNRLKPSHKNVLARQVVCEAEEEDHDWWKRSITNKTAEVLKLAERRKEFGVACKSKRTYECFCDNLSSAVYCDILYTNDIMEDRKKIAKDEIGDELPCKNELWRDIYLATHDRFFKMNTYDGINHKMIEALADSTNNKLDVGEDLQSSYAHNATDVEEICYITPQVHNFLRKLRYVDIHFRIDDDLLRMKFLSLVPFDFCNQDYLFSKCICDEQSSAAFCVRYFVKQAAIVFVNETMCDNYSVNSVTSISFFYSIIATTLLYSIIF
ncbi:hypothetical protein PRIPAC_92015 [Pristionchus pacificus]|uniref:Uncharacterized protein n=1 Tax=Pristionchus pacificus TaxID=54126 RepID=A0A2A6CH09_PRIPA|nr:hypothetical protein PRIPAC_92015 [Pristionchus pacificus]|eukprot:PDM77492.1 hypothetical protein PRIPAC_34359 [Pristionchus pacificus]